LKLDRMSLSVLIIGGGIGGLALAHGLRRAGVHVEVYERTRQRTDWLQGYRIHINPAGARALRSCLPPSGWPAFLATASTGDGGFGFLTDQGAELLGLTADEITTGSARHYAVSRIRLRETLLAGLADVVHLGREFTHYTVAGERVTACFADGSTATGDLLVGADGANSRVRGQLLPDAHRVDTGVLTVVGKHPMAGLAPPLSTRANIVVPRGRGSLFTAVWQQDGADGYALWGFADARERFPADVEDRPGAALRQVVTDRMRGWAPAFHRLAGDSDPATVTAFRVRSAAPVRPWATGRVTLLGDAIHNMTPMAGVGANTALRDADLLRRTLADSGTPLIPALARYEREMLDYGFAAVRQSLRNAERAGNSTRLGRAGFRTALRLTAAVPPIRRAMARNLGN
jgi:2-polyprenyl-6-methoxyphenol hydroxylase-like FAD-dependent oxidoreductase